MIFKNYILNILDIMTLDLIYVLAVMGRELLICVLAVRVETVAR